jgi:hypothetical protein
MRSFKNVSIDNVEECLQSDVKYHFYLTDVQYNVIEMTVRY